MSLSAIPSALAREISPAAFPARSDCAAAALLCLDSTAADINARSGFLDTVASPLVITPGSNVDVVEVADGEVTRREGGLLTASTMLSTPADVPGGIGVLIVSAGDRTLCRRIIPGHSTMSTFAVDRSSDRPPHGSS